MKRNVIVCVAPTAQRTIRTHTERAASTCHTEARPQCQDRHEALPRTLLATTACAQHTRRSRGGVDRTSHTNRSNGKECHKPNYDASFSWPNDESEQNCSAPKTILPINGDLVLFTGGAMTVTAAHGLLLACLLYVGWSVQSLAVAIFRVAEVLPGTDIRTTSGPRNPQIHHFQIAYLFRLFRRRE